MLLALSQKLNIYPAWYSFYHLKDHKDNQIM